jgi:hypothetical protein
MEMLNRIFPVIGSFAVLTALALTDALPASSQSNRPRPSRPGGSTPPPLPTNPIPVPRPSAGIVAQNSGNFGSNPSSARLINPPITPPIINNSTNP